MQHAFRLDTRISDPAQTSVAYPLRPTQPFQPFARLACGFGAKLMLLELALLEGIRLPLLVLKSVLCRLFFAASSLRLQLAAARLCLTQWRHFR